MYWKRLFVAIIAASAVATGLVALQGRDAVASDHDDGENDLKARSLNITDVYVFREDWQTGVSGDAANLIVVMNTNPRSVARQAYYFSTQARYEMHFSKIADNTVRPMGADDRILRWSFGAPAAGGEQPITLTVVDGTDEESFPAGNTTNLASSTGDTALGLNAVAVDGGTIDVFAGLREDPFFFDVEAYFRARGGEGAAALRAPDDAVDFTAGYNVNAIVARIPIDWLNGDTGETTFDVWTTVSVPMVIEE